MERVVLFRGVSLDIRLVRNPKLRRVIQDRRGDFMFNHSEHTEYGDGHTEGPHHTDGFRGGHDGDYSEASGHCDYRGNNGRPAFKLHEDTTRKIDHRDQHTDENNYDNFHETDVHSEFHTDFGK